ncbi:type IV pilin-like G/H family protein [Altericista sp. CCNU0014]
MEQRTCRRTLLWNHKTQQGFTLIELLVSVVVIAILAAIALPSYLNQAGKARGSEAKSNLGTINRAQQAYRFSNGTFASDINDLELDAVTLSSQHYVYSVVGSVGTATAVAEPNSNDYKVYAAGVAQGNDNTSIQIICESLQSKGAASDNTATVNVNAGPPAIASCSAGSRLQ